MLDKYTTKELLDELTSRNEDVPPNGEAIVNIWNQQDKNTLKGGEVIAPTEYYKEGNKTIADTKEMLESHKKTMEEVRTKLGFGDGKYGGVKDADAMKAFGESARKLKTPCPHGCIPATLESTNEPTFKDSLLDNQETIIKIVKQALAREGKSL